MKRLLCLTTALLCTAFLLAGCGAGGQPPPEALLEADYLAPVGECEVPPEEYRLFAQDSIATVAGDYARTLDADPTLADLFPIAHGGQRPLDHL